MYLIPGNDFGDSGVKMRMNIGSPKKMLIEALERLLKGYTELKK